MRISVATAPNQVARMCQVSAPHIPCVTVARIRVLRPLSMIALAFIIVGCGFSAPTPDIDRAPTPDIDELAVVERGEHPLGAASLVDNEWELTPTQVTILDGRTTAGVRVIGRRAIVVTYEVENLSTETRRVVDFGPIRSESSGYRGYGYDIWLGAIGDREGAFFKGAMSGWDYRCYNLVVRFKGSTPTWRKVASIGVDIRQSERVEFAACWDLPANSVPPYTLYLGSNDTTRITFDLSPVVVDDEPVDKPVDGGRIGSEGDTAG